MQAFKTSLPNGATLSGHFCNPEPSSPSYVALDDSRRPLVVAIHGGSYSSTYFDADAKHSAVLCSKGLGVPVVAIDRPLYQGTSSFYPLPEGKSYHDGLAVHLHEHILPTLWKEYGQGCGSMVLLCHSLAVPSAVMLAGWHARERAQGDTPAYPLSGLIVHGFGSQNKRTIVEQNDETPPEQMPEFIDIPLEVKDTGMFDQETVDPAIYKQTKRLNNPMPYAELGDYKAVWGGEKWRALCGAVELPVMIGIAEKDSLWEGTEEHVREFAGGFSGSERVDASLVKGAPHCIELSLWAQGWYARCFGWALECATAYAVKELKT